MDNNNKANVQEFTLEVDSELRFEIESKNKKVTVEVNELIISRKYIITWCNISFEF